MARKSSPSVVQRFRGSVGKKRLIDLLMSYPLLSGSRAASSAICEQLRLLPVPADYEITTQGGQDNDLYFMISGSARVVVNGREVASRRAGDHVGEMTMLDRTAIRSATVVTTEPCVVGTISEADFTRVANRHPFLWRKLAITIAERLRQRNRFHTAPRIIPVVFVGSSSESLHIAKMLCTSLSRKRTEPRVWAEGVFQCTRATIEDLTVAAGQTDFALLVLSADDVTVSHGRKKASPRDNIIFELGLFMGALGRDRTYVVAPAPLDIKIPTDLLGVTLLTYSRRRGQSLSDAMKPVTRELLRLIHRYGPK
jgi:CRP/FNR family transcriptional regulator, cyclic AMP receptor protein